MANPRSVRTVRCATSRRPATRGREAATPPSIPPPWISIGRDQFYSRFAGDPWNLPDLADWYSSPATLAAQPFDWARARLYAR
ncbi:MAG: hypothetical protein ACTHOJ_07855 [Sphingomonas oligoaromativorans]